MKARKSFQTEHGRNPRRLDNEAKSRARKSLRLMGQPPPAAESETRRWTNKDPAGWQKSPDQNRPGAGKIRKKLAAKSKGQKQRRQPRWRNRGATIDAIDIRGETKIPNRRTKSFAAGRSNIPPSLAKNDYRSS